MNRKKTIAIGLLAIALIITVLAATGVFRSDEGAGEYLGYVEGETSLIGSPIAGRLIERAVERGARVRAGDQLFTIDPDIAKSDVTRAEAAVAEARARYANLLTGKRQPEQEIVRAQEREVEAQLALAEKELRRQTELVKGSAAPKTALEQAQAQVHQLQARLASLKAQENVGTLAARPNEIKAAANVVAEAEANLSQARARLDDLMPRAPEEAMVENTFYNPGEWVTAGTPIVSLLAAGRVKLRFFIPEQDLSRAKIGSRIRFSYDGHPSALGATITYISPRAEFTPPVIYSQSARTKLVFLIEAKPDSGATLSPGLPVSVIAFAH